jgi:glutamine amidotransferase
MCQLLALSCAEPTDVSFSLTGFAARGGLTDHHVDGWGVAFYEDRACRVFVDEKPAYQSPVADFLKSHPIKSRNVVAHIRKATQGGARVENCHPFMRELRGQQWVFAHNGDLTAPATSPRLMSMARRDRLRRSARPIAKRRSASS